MSHPLQEALELFMVVLMASVVVAVATVVVAHSAMARQDWRQRDLPVWEAVGFGPEDARAWARVRFTPKGATAWRAAGFEAAVAGRWRHHYFKPEEEARYAFGEDPAGAWETQTRTMAKQQSGAAGPGPADEGAQIDESSPCR